MLEHVSMVAQTRDVIAVNIELEQSAADQKPGFQKDPQVVSASFC